MVTDAKIFVWCLISVLLVFIGQELSGVVGDIFFALGIVVGTFLVILLIRNQFDFPNL